MAVDKANQRMIKSFSNLALSFAKAQMRTREANEKAIGQETSIKFKNDVREQFYRMSIKGDAQDDRGNLITNAHEFERYQNELSDKYAEGLSPTARNAFLGRIVSTRESMFSQSINWQLNTERKGRLSIQMDSAENRVDDTTLTFKEFLYGDKYVKEDKGFIGDMDGMSKNGMSEKSLKDFDRKGKYNFTENKIMFEIDAGDYEEAIQIAEKSSNLQMIDEADKGKLIKRIRTAKKQNALATTTNKIIDSILTNDKYKKSTSKKEKEGVEDIVSAQMKKSNDIPTGFLTSWKVESDLKSILEENFDDKESIIEARTFFKLDRKRVTKLPANMQKLFEEIPTPLLKEMIDKVKQNERYRKNNSILVPELINQIQNEVGYKAFVSNEAGKFNEEDKYLAYYLYRSMMKSNQPKRWSKDKKTVVERYPLISENTKAKFKIYLKKLNENKTNTPIQSE